MRLHFPRTGVDGHDASIRDRALGHASAAPEADAAAATWRSCTTATPAGGAGSTELSARRRRNCWIVRWPTDYAWPTSVSFEFLMLRRSPS